MAHRYFDPDALTRLGNLELVARQIVEGFLSGRHRSPYHGFSVEYLDHRAYAPGDDLRGLNWKLAARTDKYYVKLFQDETNLRAYLLLDCSRSMAFASGPLSKLQYSSYLAAALAHLMFQQKDAVGLVLFDRDVRDFLWPRARRTQVRRILDRLEHTQPGGETAIGDVLHTVAERIRRRSLIILLSDCLDELGSIAHGLQHFRHDGHEVIVFHVLDRAEQTLPYDRLTQFRDMEGSAWLLSNPGDVRRAYLARLDRFLAELKDACHERGIDYALTTTDEPYDRFLAQYLEKRGRLG
jgi:uncharacterized protein (DUF58 family)